MAALMNKLKLFQKIISAEKLASELDTAITTLEDDAQTYLTNTPDGLAPGCPVSSALNVIPLGNAGFLVTLQLFIGQPAASISGGVTGNLVSIDADDLPADSGIAATDVEVEATIDGMYICTFAGADTTGADANAAVTTGNASITPAAGDVVVAVWGQTTATGVADPVVVGTDFAAALVNDSGIKITQKQAAGNKSAMDYIALCRPAR